MATYEKKYKLKLEKPVQVEVYPDHEDFAVRTLGMPGLGALGVTFGYSVAMDSPSGRKPGTFHWAVHAVARNEPRVHAHRHRPSRAALVHRRPGGARRDRHLAGLGRPPQSRRDQRHQEQEAAADRRTGSRLRASHRARRRSSSAISRRAASAITSTKSGAGTRCSPCCTISAPAKTLRLWSARNLKIEPDDFDKQFLAYVEADTKNAVDHFDEWKKGLKSMVDKSQDQGLGRRHQRGHRDPRPVSRLRRRAQRLRGAGRSLPRQGQQAGGHRGAAALRKDRRARPGIAQAAVQDPGRGGPQERGRRRLEPPEFHLPDGPCRASQPGWPVAGSGQREGRDPRICCRAGAAIRRIPAQAHYDLARAYHADKQIEQAKEELLAALEAAPGFRPAQKLLLELSTTDS